MFSADQQLLLQSGGAIAPGGMSLLQSTLAQQRPQSQIRCDEQSCYKLLSLPLQGIMAVIYIGVFGTVVGYVFFLNAVQRLGSATAALFFNLIPVCAALTAVIMGQNVTAVQVGGMAIVLCGLMLPQLLKLLRPGTAVQPCQNS